MTRLEPPTHHPILPHPLSHKFKQIVDHRELPCLPAGGTLCQVPVTFRFSPKSNAPASNSWPRTDTGAPPFTIILYLMLGSTEANRTSRRLRDSGKSPRERAVEIEMRMLSPRSTTGSAPAANGPSAHKIASVPHRGRRQHLPRELL